MNALLLLMGLLVLSYIGSFLVGGRAIRGFGLPSGSEYLLLGFVIGPNVLGLIERSMLDSFEPIATPRWGGSPSCWGSTTRSSGTGAFASRACFWRAQSRSSLARQWGRPSTSCSRA
jgi:hypothetical protein